MRLLRSVLFFPDGSTGILAGEAAIESYLRDFEGRFLQSIKTFLRSEERRVGKECRSGRSSDRQKKKMDQAVRTSKIAARGVTVPGVAPRVQGREEGAC